MKQEGEPRLATGVGASCPVHSDCLGDVQLLVQLLGNGGGSIFGFNDGHTTKLGTGAAHQPPGEGLGVQAILLEEGLFLHHKDQIITSQNVMSAWA